MLYDGCLRVMFEENIMTWCGLYLFSFLQHVRSKNAVGWETYLTSKQNSKQEKNEASKQKLLFSFYIITILIYH